jgi:hypothetical protein
MYAVFYFLPLYFTLILSYTSSKTGTNLLYYLPGLAGGAYLAIFLCNVYPRTTFHPLALGTLVEPLGITLLAIAIHQGNLHLVYGMLALTGVGTGVRFMPGTLHGVGYYRGQIASVVALMQLAISLGGTIATTIMLNILNSHLGSGHGHPSTSGTDSFEAIAGLSLAAQEVFRGRAKEGIVLAFFWNFWVSVAWSCAGPGIGQCFYCEERRGR